MIVSPEVLRSAELADLHELLFTLAGVMLERLPSGAPLLPEFVPSVPAASTPVLPALGVLYGVDLVDLRAFADQVVEVLSARLEAAASGWVSTLPPEAVSSPRLPGGAS